MTIDEFVAALRAAMPEMHKRGWVPVTWGERLRLRGSENDYWCPIEALTLLRGLPLQFFTVEKAMALGLTFKDAAHIIDAADVRGPKHAELRSRLIGAYQDYCATLRTTTRRRKR